MSQEEQDQPYALEISSVSKTFDGHRVLSDVSFAVRPGEVRALVGENGSGKSTLVKCLCGYQSPDPGAVIKIGETTFDAPFDARRARRAGLRAVHQDLGIVPTMSVTENLAFGPGFTSAAAQHINWKAEHGKARSHLQKSVGLEIAPQVLAGTMSQAAQTLVALARATREDAGVPTVVLLDETSACLPQADLDHLHDAVRRLSAAGVAIIMISHRLAEVFELASSVTVLRDGNNVGTFELAELDRDSLVELMIGRPLAEITINEELGAQSTSQPSLSVRELCGGLVDHADLEIYPGEVVGLAGLRGSGRSTMARLITGTQIRDGGRVVVGGTEVPGGHVKAAIKAGLVYISEDRRRDEALLAMSIQDNLLIPRMAEFCGASQRLRRSAMRTAARQLIEEYDVRPPRPEAKMGSLSGGNQQKVILARWLSLNPSIAILDEPVKGIDVGAKGEIFEFIRRAASSRGLGFLVIDSDFENLAALSTRVLTVNEGRITGELQGPCSEDDIARAVFEGSRRTWTRVSQP